jgi:hypothetical protein
MRTPVVPFALRMTAAAMLAATVGASFVLGYYIGHRQGLTELYLAPAVVVIRESQLDDSIAETTP